MEVFLCKDIKERYVITGFLNLELVNYEIKTWKLSYVKIGLKHLFTKFLLTVVN